MRGSTNSIVRLGSRPEAVKTAAKKKKPGQYLAILTEQACYMEDNTIFSQLVIPSGQDGHLTHRRAG